MVAKWLKEASFSRLHGDPAAMAHLLALSRSEFPAFLRKEGRIIRRGTNFAGKVLPAQEEYRVVEQAIRRCLACCTRQLPLDIRDILSKQMDQLNQVLTITFAHDEGTLVYRDVRDSWRKLDAYVNDGSVYNQLPGSHLLHYGDKKTPSAMEAIVAQLAICSFEDIPRLCSLCPRYRLANQKYCHVHNPSAPGKVGYERARRVERYIESSSELRQRIRRVREYRTRFSDWYDFPLLDSFEWVRSFNGELTRHVDESWSSRSLFSTFLPIKADATREEIINSLSTLADNTDPLNEHPRYLARRVIEFMYGEEADKKIKKWHRLSVEAINECMSKNGGSIALTAAELGIRADALRMKLSRKRRMGGVGEENSIST